MLGVLIVAYSGWSLAVSSTSSALAAAGGSTGDPEMDRLVTTLSSTLTYGVYGGMAVIGGLVTGLTAWYYFSRRGVVRKMVESTPGWVIEAMKAAG
jgi:hypothetical protein